MRCLSCGCGIDAFSTSDFCDYSCRYRYYTVICANCGGEVSDTSVKMEQRYNDALNFCDRICRREYKQNEICKLIDERNQELIDEIAELRQQIAELNKKLLGDKDELLSCMRESSTS